MRSVIVARFVAAAILLVACAPTTQRLFVAPTRDTITSDTEERQGNPSAHLVFVANHSTVPVVVFGTSLTSCENVKQQCGPRAANLRIEPGQRQLVLRIEPSNTELGFSYRFGFSWRADSSDAKLLSTLAANGNEGAQQRLASMRLADSLQRNMAGLQVNELTRDDFRMLAGQIAALRVMPDSLVITPGSRASVRSLGLVVVDSAGKVLGGTHWVRWQMPSSEHLLQVPPDGFVAQSVGRTSLYVRLADEAQTIVGHPIADLAVPIVVAYPADPNAPLFQGLALDADTRTPLGCASVALEDSAQNVVARDRTARMGMYVLGAPRPGTYRVRVEAPGWAPVYGPWERAQAGDTKQAQVMVTFVDQLLADRPARSLEEIRHAYPASVSTAPYGRQTRGAATPIVSGVTLGGSPSTPILGILSAAPPGETWVQFVVDSTGRVDTASVQLPHDTSPAARASVRSVLPRVRFSPARVANRPICELQRMQVTFSKR